MTHASFDGGSAPAFSGIVFINSDESSTLVTSDGLDFSAITCRFKKSRSGSTYLDASDQTTLLGLSSRLPEGEECIPPPLSAESGTGKSETS